MCPNPGMILKRTATASLALPSAVCVAGRVQSHWSQRSAFFGRRCPQYGQGILSPALGSGRVAGASVYSTFIAIVSSEGHKTRGVRQAKRRQNITDYAHHADKTTNSGLICFLGFETNSWLFSLISYL